MTKSCEQNLSINQISNSISENSTKNKDAGKQQPEKKLTQAEKPSHRSNAAKAVNRSQYPTAIRHVFRSEAGKKALQDFFKKQCRKEATAYGVGERELSKKVTQTSVNAFSWKAILSDIKKNMPWIFACLSAVLARTPYFLYVAISMERVCLLLDWLSHYCSIDGILEDSTSYKSFVPSKCGVVEVIKNIILQLFQSFQRLGISKGKEGTLSSVDRLTRQFDKEIVDWKEEVEGSLEQSVDVDQEEIESVTSQQNLPILDHSYAIKHSEQPFSPPMDLSPEMRIDRSRTDGDVDVTELQTSPLMDQSPNIPMDVSPQMNTSAQLSKAENEMKMYKQPADPEDENLEWIDNLLESISFPDSPKPSDSGDTIAAIEHPGYCLVWDNVQLLSTVRHQTSEKRNRMLLWALCFAARNRISFRHLPDHRMSPVQRMPLNMFLPNNDDFANLKTRMVVIAMRILKDHVHTFNNLDVIAHIPHQYTDESSMKTRIVNLGVIEENPSSIQGVIGIMDILHTYVPKINDDQYHVIPVHGDGLSIERMRDAKAARSGSETAAARLEGIEPVPQEFHKRAILMQDTYSETYSSRSGADRGTLFQIRNAFGHNNVCGEVMKSFNHNADLLRFATEGLTTLLAMQLVQGDVQERDEDLLDLAGRVVDTVWQQVPATDIEAVVDAEEDDDDDDDDDEYYEYCFCKEDKAEPMVKCSNTVACRNGAWFHIDCVGVDLNDIGKVDWCCSDECQATGRSQYCICQLYTDKETVHCIRGANCSGYEVYHKECIGLKRKPGKKWICHLCQESAKGQRSSKKEDHIYNYSCALLYHGLKDLAYRDAVRENDGEAMVSHWRIDMPQFWQKKHNKYLIIGHKFLSDVQGQANTRLRNEIVWNRTANLRGGAGHNLPLDLVNEFLNRDFKESMKRCHGRYTGKHVRRTSKFIGTLQKDLDQAFQRQISGVWIPQTNGSGTDFKNDVVKFLNEYREDDLFKWVPGREHSAIPGFARDPTINNVVKLKARLKKYARKLDMYRALLP